MGQNIIFKIRNKTHRGTNLRRYEIAWISSWFEAILGHIESLNVLFIFYLDFFFNFKGSMSTLEEVAKCQLCTKKSKKYSSKQTLRVLKFTQKII